MIVPIPRAMRAPTAPGNCSSRTATCCSENPSGVIVFGEKPLDATVDPLTKDFAGELQLLGGIVAQPERLAGDRTLIDVHRDVIEGARLSRDKRDRPGSGTQLQGYAAKNGGGAGSLVTLDGTSRPEVLSAQPATKICGPATTPAL